MNQQQQYQLPYRRPYPAPPFQVPGIRLPGVLGTLILASGLIAVASMAAPGPLEQALPGWRERFGALILLGVGLGFVRALFRLAVPLAGLAFWITAVACMAAPFLGGTGIPGLRLPTSLPGVSRAAPALEVNTESSPAYYGNSRPKGSALPDAAYFGGTTNQAPISGALSNVLPPSIGRFLRGTGL